MIQHRTFLRAFTISELAFQKLNKGSKNSKLREYLTKSLNQTELPDAVVHTIDGCALLHLVQWLCNTTYSGVIK